MKKILVSILIFEIIAFIIIFILKSPLNPFVVHTGDQTRETSPDCQIDTASWQNYVGGEYTIKYPKDWFSKSENGQEGSTYWTVSFGPSNLASLVYIGGSAPDVDQFKQDLIAASGQGFQIKKEETETVSGAQATKFTVEGGSNYPYLTYIYYIPLGNVPAIIKGPARSNHFATSCQPEIFAEMVKSYNFRGMGPWTGSENNASNQTYTDAACGFSFQYPQDWTITENYYYETAGGETATTPTIILKNNAGDATISINLRQKFCMETPGVSKTREPLYGESPIYIDFMNYLDQGQTCGQVDVTAPDKNGKDSSYRIVAEFPNNQTMIDTLKNFVRSFQKIE